MYYSHVSLSINCVFDTNSTPAPSPHSRSHLCVHQCFDDHRSSRRSGCCMKHLCYFTSQRLLERPHLGFFTIIFLTLLTYAAHIHHVTRCTPQIDSKIIVNNSNSLKIIVKKMHRPTGKMPAMLDYQSSPASENTKTYSM